MSKPVLIENFIAGADIIANRVVHLDGDDTVTHAVDGTVVPLGIAINDAAAGERVDVVTIGIVGVKTAVNLPVNSVVMAAADGQVITAIPDRFTCGVTRDVSQAGDVVGIKINHFMR